MASGAKTRTSSTPVLLGRPGYSDAPSTLKSRPSAALPPRPSSSSSEERPRSGDSIRSAGKMIMAPAPAAATRNSTTKSGVPAAPRRNTSVPAGRVAAAKPAEVVPVDDPKVVIDRQAMEGWRAELVSALASVPDFHPGDDPRAFHGRALCLDKADFPEPQVLWKSDKKPRDSSPSWLTATEYADTPKVLAAKVKLLKEMLMASRHTLAYSGAGLSVAAGIGMAAVGSKGGAGTGMGVATAGEPTISHCIMAELNRQNMLHGWVQQNHDGLPQKAGYRQEDINEIHGSWFDPSNPVVKYSGSLRGDMFEDMKTQADTADLVIVLGTSLTGLNADQCVRKTAQRSTTGNALGSVIISPQRTSQDGKAALRIFAKADDVMVALAKEFGFGPRAFGQGRGIKRSADLFTKQNRVLVPYDKNGVLSTTVKTYWDLTPGAKVRMSTYNNLEGANQPNDSGITSDTVGTVAKRDERACSIIVNIGSTSKRIGLWWLETAERGGMQHLPVVNVNAKEIRVASD